MDKTSAQDDLPLERVQAASLVRVVDDDEKMLASYRFMLRAAGWKVRCYTSAAQFLQEPQEESGCLVLDVRMPQMSGLQLFSEMNRRKMILPVIFVTGHGDVDMAVETMKNGAGDFMLKPVDPERLKTAVLQWCRESCRRRQNQLYTNALHEDFSTLTERERQVMERVADGLPNKSIAAELSISERTVKFHRASLFEKLGVKSAAQLISRVMQFRSLQSQEGVKPREVGAKDTANAGSSDKADA